MPAKEPKLRNANARMQSQKSNPRTFKHREPSPGIQVKEFKPRHANPGIHTHDFKPRNLNSKFSNQLRNHVVSVMLIRFFNFCSAQNFWIEYIELPVSG